MATKTECDVDIPVGHTSAKVEVTCYRFHGLRHRSGCHVYWVMSWFYKLHKMKAFNNFPSRWVDQTVAV